MISTSKNKKITIIGSGALGTAFANLLVDAGQKNVLVYGIDNQELEDLKKGQNTKYFSKETTFNKMNVSNDFEQAINGAEYIIIALPSIVIDDVITKIDKTIRNSFLIVNGSKGFYPNTETSIHSGIENKLKNNQYFRGCVTLSGPSFALEIVEKSLTTICAISHKLELAQEIQQMFYTNYFKLYTQTDVIGAEVGGIYKNILAIGSGIITQLGYKINTIASFLTRGMNEMSTFNNFMGGKLETIYGLSGLGDLILTATDMNSRNFTFGKKFVQDKSIFQKDSKITLEGVFALKIVENIRKKNNLYLPIAEAIYNIIFEQKDVKEQIDKLWNKNLKEERNHNE